MSRKRLRLPLSALGRVHHSTSADTYRWSCELCHQIDSSFAAQNSASAAERQLVEHLRDLHGARGGEVRVRG